MIKVLKQNLDFLLFALIVAAFVTVAAQGLGAVPLPDSDEVMTLQVPYEILHHGKLAFPMYRFLGGNIENAWHSYTPVFFAILSGFMKLFGWGLTQGRAFNLMTAALVLLMLYLIARRLFDSQVGLIATVFVISDPVFLARSRLARNDMLAAAFGLLAYYLYEKAEEQKANRYYFASGLAAGAGVMCHTNLLYIFAVIAALMLLRRGWRLLKSREPYLFAAGALVVMSYEILYDIIDYQNFILQNRKDEIHFRVLGFWGWWHNLLAEPARYIDWFNARGTRFRPETALLHVFLLMTLVAIIYLAAWCVIRMKQSGAMSEPRVRALVATVVVALFFALVTQRKVTQYVVHLSPWFALCVGVLIRDGMAAIAKLSERRWRWAKAAYSTSLVLAVLVFAVYGYELIKQNEKHLVEARNPNVATFDEIKEALTSIVPDGVCPASIGSAYLWLAFPEFDQCYFAQMEARLDEPLDLDGKEYAIIVQPKLNARLEKLTGGAEKYHLLGELRKTAYGTFNVYYTGTNPRYLSIEPKHYYFFGHGRGRVSSDQIAASREIWAAEGPKLSQYAEEVSSGIELDEISDDAGEKNKESRKLINLCAVDLNANTIYRVSVDTSNEAGWSLLIVDDGTGALIQDIENSDQKEPKHFDGLFKTANGNRVRLAIRRWGAKASDALPVSRIGISEIARM